MRPNLALLCLVLLAGNSSASQAQSRYEDAASYDYQRSTLAAGALIGLGVAGLAVYGLRSNAGGTPAPAAPQAARALEALSEARLAAIESEINSALSGEGRYARALRFSVEDPRTGQRGVLEIRIRNAADAIEQIQIVERSGVSISELELLGARSGLTSLRLAVRSAAGILVVANLFRSGQVVAQEARDARVDPSCLGEAERCEPSSGLRRLILNE